MAKSKLERLQDEAVALSSERQDRIVELCQAYLEETAGEPDAESRAYALFRAQRHPDVVELDGKIRDVVQQKLDLPEYQEDLARATRLAEEQRRELHAQGVRWTSTGDRFTGSEGD